MKCVGHTLQIGIMTYRKQKLNQIGENSNQLSYIDVRKGSKSWDAYSTSAVQHINGYICKWTLINQLISSTRCILVPSSSEWRRELTHRPLNQDVFYVFKMHKSTNKGIICTVCLYNYCLAPWTCKAKTMFWGTSSQNIKR